MKAMFMLDALTIKKYFLSQVFTSIFVGIILLVATKVLFALIPYVGCMISFSLAFSLMAFDERNNWQQFRLALPLTRKDVIAGRYFSLLVLMLITIFVGVVVFAAVILATWLFPTSPVLVDFAQDASNWGIGMLGASALSLAIMLFTFAVTLPFAARLGMTKAVRFIPLVIIIFIPLIMFFLGQDSLDFLLPFLTWLQTDTGFCVFSLMAVLGSFLVYITSCALAVRLYTQREF